jgi:exopolyphosphatase/guanosine-5'-triphosphate,3'-diphosphate pyrophosphatase
MTRVAAIDCGTNSIRLLVADLPALDGVGAPLTDVVRRMEIVRLGEGVDRTGRLAPAAIARTRAALADYARQVADCRADRVRMVATSATRDAANADEFQAMVVSTLGVPPEVVTGDEEARLSFLGAVRGLPATAEAPYLVVDIGGGSTEFVLGGDDGEDAGRVQHAISVDIGCVRMTERHLRDDPPTPDQVAAAEADVAAALERALQTVPAKRARTLIGLAGSVTTVAALALRLNAYDPARIHHARIPYADVAEVTANLLALTHAQRLVLPPMHPGRADVIGAGALILRVLMEGVGADAVIASEHDILDGIAWSMA